MRGSLRAVSGLLLVLMSAALAPLTTFGQNTTSPAMLAPAAAPELIDCGPETVEPCFTLHVTPADATGTPIPTAMPSRDQLLAATRVTTDSGQIAPFYVHADDAGNAGRRPTMVLIEVDISGSMNAIVAPGVTRFDAAKAAIGEYLSTMQEGVDQVAIVPFESHHVVSTIQSAVFSAHRDEALHQLRALPAPGSKNNTALYQAVYTGIQTLGSRLKTQSQQGDVSDDTMPRLIVMTDGRNEVLRGDDPVLLDGPLGLEQAAAQVRSSGFDAVGIGFGNKDDIDVAALSKLSKRYFLAASPGELKRVFGQTAPLHTSTVEVAFLAPWPDRPSLSGRDQQFAAMLTLPDGQVLRSAPMQFLAPAMGTPLYQRHAAAAEMAALVASRPPAPQGWNIVVRGMLIFAGFAALLALLWFGVPRLVWGGQYMGEVPVDAPSRRWSKEPAVQASGVQVRPAAGVAIGAAAPQGFEACSSIGQQQRSAAQVTQVQPRTEFSRTRLIRDAQ